MTIPATCDLSTLSGALQITSRRVQQLAKEGVVHKAGRGKYEFLRSIQGYITFLNQLVPNKSALDGDEVTADIKVEQCKLVSEKAMIAKMERKEMEGTLLLASEVKRDAYTTAVTVRQAMMLIPDSQSPLLAQMDDAREIRTALRAAITQGLTDASELIVAGVEAEQDEESSLVDLDEEAA